MKQSKIAKSYLKLFTEREVHIGVLDSYGTIKRKLMDASSFFEVTLSSGEKKVFAKRSIVELGIARLPVSSESTITN